MYCPYKGFQSAYGELVRYLALPIETPRDRAGIIKAFGLTFELAWKTFYKMAKAERVDNVTGPRSSLRWAFKAGIISPEEETLWPSMLQDKNLTNDIYKKQLSQEMTKRIQKDYKQAFGSVLERLAAKLCN